MHDADHENGSGVSSPDRKRRAIDKRLWRVAPILVIATAGAAQAAPRVLVWSDEPATDAVRQAGFESLDFAPIAGRLQAQREAARELERETLAAAQTGLAHAKQAYLEQRFDDMIAELTELETESLDVLSRPEHIGVLWEIEFQLGLAYMSRARKGDATLARERFELALSLDAERRPLKDLYGPGVATAFAEAVAARAAKTPRPVALAVQPRDARVWIDGVTVVDTSQPRNVRTGKHVVRSTAPGFSSWALIQDVGSERSIPIALFETADRDADATPDTRSGQAAIRAIAGRAGAAVVVFVQIDSATRHARVRVVTADDVSAVVTTVAEALDLLAPDGTLRVEPTLDPLSPRGASPTPVYKTWWFWMAIGAAAVTAVAVSLAASDAPAHIQIFAPGERP